MVTGFPLLIHNKPFQKYSDSLHLRYFTTENKVQHAEHREHLGHMIPSHLDCYIFYTDLRPVSDAGKDVTLVP